LNQHLIVRNVKLQHCEYYINVAKYRFNVEKTLQKRLMSAELQYLQNIPKHCSSTSRNIDSTFVQYPRISISKSPVKSL